MDEKIIQDLAEGRIEQGQLKETLSALRSAIKEPQWKAKAKELLGDGRQLVGLLYADEPKVRRNAALLLGDLDVGTALQDIYEAYCAEETLFIRSAYVTAMGKLQPKEYLPMLQKRLKELGALAPEEHEKKHFREEMRELEKVITNVEGIKKHTFCGFKTPQEFLLTAAKGQRDAVISEIKELPAEVSLRWKEHPLGVLVLSRQLAPFLRLRTYRELLFPIRGVSQLPAKPKEAATALFRTDIISFLESCHKEAAPFYFRLELKSRMELKEKTEFAKKFAAELEDLTGRKLINSTSNYEIEIRLVETKEGMFLPFLKLGTIPMKRFAYRKNVIAASMHPANAAVLVRLAKPYLKEHAQILDPFCGVGTLLIERDLAVLAREKYGIDMFGDAIVMARENAALAGEQINFIHRDYFDFKHEYLFDEIITDMPVRGKKTKEEQDAFYARFFEKSRGILKEDGVIILYSNEQGFVKKQLRLRADYRLLQEFCIREKDGFYLYIIGIKR